MSLNIYTIPLADFDRSLLPEEAQEDADLFVDALKNYFVRRYHDSGQNVIVELTDEAITVVTFPLSVKDPAQLVLSLLNQGKLKEAVPYLRTLSRAEPWNTEHFYNLGIAQSELKQYEDAIMSLQQVIKLDASHVNALTGLGVAYQHLSQPAQAEKYFKQALGVDPNNFFAARNLGAVLGGQQRFADALPFVEVAYKSNPNDVSGIYGLARVLDELGGDDNWSRADGLYEDIIKHHSLSRFAEVAKTARTAIAQKFMRKRGGDLRMDVVMYIASILEVFKKEGPKRRQQITFEVAMVGTKGLDINNSEQKYTLQSMPGKRFSGLHLLSIMYAGFRQIDPTADVGADFSKEYEAAQTFANPKG